MLATGLKKDKHAAEETVCRWREEDQWYAARVKLCRHIQRTIHLPVWLLVKPKHL